MNAIMVADGSDTNVLYLDTDGACSDLTIGELGGPIDVEMRLDLEDLYGLQAMVGRAIAQVERNIEREPR